jgi:hypothetical protein
MRSSKVRPYAIVVVVFFWASLCGHWLPNPNPVRSALFVITVLLGLVMIVTGWQGWVKSRNAEAVPYWRKGVGLAGVTSNTLLAIPLATLLYRLHYPFSLVAVFGFTATEADRITRISLVLTLSALIAGIFADPRCRFAILIGGLAIGSVVLSIPFGWV